MDGNPWVMRQKPTERAMGAVTIISGLAVPVGILIGAGPLEGGGKSVEIFDKIMWMINPIGMWGIEPFRGLVSAILLYILGTMVSAFCWGMIDAWTLGKNLRRG